MFLKILIALAALVAVLVAVVALQPAHFSVTRSATFAAPPRIVFDQVNDLRNWDAWSPWAKLDPDMKQTFEGPAAGVGAAQSWAGDNQVGEGRMTITESRPGELVRMKLEFIKPMAATNTAEFTFQPDGDGTRVTWTMSGKNNFVCKAVGLVMNMDKMVGDQFEQGLAEMRTITEAAAKTP